MASSLSPSHGESFQQRLRKTREEKRQAKGPIRAVIPGCEVEWETDDGKKHKGHLVAVYRPLDYETVREITPDLNAKDALAEKTAAASFLATAAIDVEAIEDGCATSLGVKMGTSLAEYLGADLDGIDGDTQAIIAMFPAEEDIKLMAHYGQVTQKMGLVDNEVLEELLGNSEAASA